MGTIGTEVEKIVDQYGIKALIWDHARRTHYRNIVLHFISRFDFILLFYRTDNLESFQSLDEWLKSIKENCPDHGEIILVGNKGYFEYIQKVSKEEALKFANNHCLRHFKISTLTREGCSAPFDYCAERVKNRRDSLLRKYQFLAVNKGSNSFNIPYEKGVLIFGENKYKHWEYNIFPNSINLQEGHLEELTMYCYNDSIPYFIKDIQELHNEILYWNSDKVVQQSLNQGVFNNYEDLVIIRRSQEYCVNRGSVCRASKLLEKLICNAKGKSVIFLEIRGDNFSSLVFDIFVGFHRMSDYIIPFDVFDEFERFCVFYECDCILKHLSYHRIDSIIQSLLKNDIVDIESFLTSLSYTSIVSLLSQDSKYLFRHENFFKLGIGLHFLVFSIENIHITKDSLESKDNNDPSDFIFFLNSLIGYHGICCINLLGYLIYNNLESPHIFDILKNNFSKSSILFNLFSSMKSHSEQICNKDQQTKKRFLLF